MTEFLQQYWQWLLLGGAIVYWYRDRLSAISGNVMPPPVVRDVTPPRTAAPQPKNIATIVFDLGEPAQLDVFHVATAMLKSDHAKATKLIDLASSPVAPAKP